MQLRSFARNTFFLVASQAFGAVTTLAFVPLLARYLGLENYGRYSYVYAFVGLFEVLSVFGLHQIFVREVARDRQKASGYLGNVLRLKILLSLGVFTLIYLASRILVEPGLQLFVVIVATEVLLRKFFLINLALARAVERMEYELVVTIFERTTALAGVLAAIRFDWGLGGILLAFLAAAIVHAFLATLLVWKRLVRPDFTRIQGFGRLFFSNSWPLGVSHQASVAYGRIGPVLLDHWHGPAMVGAYSGGYRIYQILQIVVAEAISRAALPTFSRLSLEPQRLTRFMHRVVLLDALMGACLGVFLWMLAPIAIGVLLGPEFAASVSILRLMAVAVPFAYLSSLSSTALQSLDLQFIDGFLTIGTLLVSLVCSLILIPAFGGLGSAWALIAAEVFGFSTKSLALVYRGLPTVKSKRSALKQL